MEYDTHDYIEERVEALTDWLKLWKRSPEVPLSFERARIFAKIEAMENELNEFRLTMQTGLLPGGSDDPPVSPGADTEEIEPPCLEVDEDSPRGMGWVNDKGLP